MSEKNRWATVGVIVGACLIAAVYFFAGPKRQIEADSGYRLVMGTFARIVAIAEDSGTANRCIETAFAEISSAGSPPVLLMLQSGR